MSGELLYGISEWVLFVAVAGLFYLSAEAGYRYAERFGARGCAEPHGHVATIESALLGLLALLLGFAFAMAITRFDVRKQVVMEEANDLQTTFLRAQLLRQPYQAESSRLLRQYVDSRVAYYQAGADRQKIRDALERTSQLQVRLWTVALAAVRDNSDEVTTGYYVQSLNGLIDDHTKRLAAMENHVPEFILLLLFFVATMSIGVTGYSAGLKRARLLVLRAILAILVAATLLVIVDLDRPRRGLIKVSEGGMLQLQQDLDKFAVPPARPEDREVGKRASRQSPPAETRSSGR
ncbi:MAG: hypothetical protein MUF54_20485 [Polyangiaceae bacterium]|nr:hypothetical protein [Polyangiaceae bacterium]